MEKIAFYQNPLQGTMHIISRAQALIHALESCYKNNEVPLGNSGLAHQRALRNAAAWDNWFYTCPQVQGRVDDEEVIFFDDRVVDVDHLEDHPLLNPAFLRDHWEEMQDGALPVPKEYFQSLLDLSKDCKSGVRRLAHKDLKRINTSMDLVEARENPYFAAFTGLSATEQERYLEAHKAEHGRNIFLYCNLGDAKREEAVGRLSVFNNYFILFGDFILNYDNARLLGVKASVASSSATGAQRKNLSINITSLLADKDLRAKFSGTDEELRSILNKYY